MKLAKLAQALSLVFVASAAWAQQEVQRGERIEITGSSIKRIAAETPLPVQVFDYLRFSFDPTAAAVGTLNIVITLIVVIVTERLVGLESLYWGGQR